jgi:first ORF in transposon ISC1904
MVFKREDLTKDSYTTGDIAKLFNVTPRTIQQWDREGLIGFDRTPTNRRKVSKEKLIEYLKTRNMFYEDERGEKKDIIYARVSSQGQVKQGDLDRQVSYIIGQVPDLKNLVVLKETGSGLNSKRKKIQQLIRMIMNDEVSRIFVTYKERLTRFGFEYIETICNMKDVEIVVLQDKEEKTIEQELAEDIMMLLASFSGKLYGLRSHKNKE